MERYEHVAAGAVEQCDSPAELRDRAQAAKKAAYTLRRELLAYDGEGMTTVLDRKLAAARLRPGVESLARRCLSDRRNAQASSYAHQWVDLTVLLAAEQILTRAWNPDRTQLAAMVGRIVTRACEYASEAQRALQNYFTQHPDTVRVRGAVHPDEAQPLMEEAVVAELARQLGRVDQGDDAALARMVTCAQERLICRYVVMGAVVRMTHGATDEDQEAWLEALNATANPYAIIDAQGIEAHDVGEPVDGQSQRAGRLERLARQRAEMIGGVDEGLLRAMLSVTLKSFHRKRVDAGKRTARRREVEEPLSPLVDAEARRSNSKLEQEVSRSDFPLDRTALAALGDNRADRGSEILLDVAGGPAWQGFEGAAAPATERLSLMDDIVNLLLLCERETGGDGVGWLAKWYPPVSRTTEEGLAAVWSLCQALRPHYVIWPGYPDRPSDRSRRFVADVGEDLKARRPVRRQPERPTMISSTVYRNGSASGIAVDVELSARVTCWLRLLPTVEVEAIDIRHPDRDGPGRSDLDLADRVARSPEVAQALGAFMTARQAVETPGSGRIWILESAMRALEVLELLGLDDDGSDTGVWAVWETLSGAAALALDELPHPTRVSGGSPMRVSVASLAGRMQQRVDRLTAGRLKDVVATWPVPPDDVADPSDTTMAELEAVMAADRQQMPGRRTVTAPRADTGQRPAYRSGPDRTDAFDSGFALGVDLASLLRIGLVDPAARVLATRLGRPGDCAWEIRIPVRDEVARAYRSLMDRWLRWQARTSGDAVQPTDADRADFVRDYSLLLAATHLPFTLDDYLRAVALKHPAPPHLADVVCVVESGAVSARFGLREQVSTTTDAVDLVATIAHRGPPTATSVSMVVAAERTPLVTGKKKPIAQRLLALRSQLAAAGRGGARPESVKELEGQLAEPGLIAALQAEIAAADVGPPRLSRHVLLLVETIRQAEPELAAQLLAAARQGTRARRRALAAHLSRTRSYLGGVAG